MPCHPSLTEAGVRAALREDKGGGAELVSWATEDFLGEGDNFVSAVTCVRARYSEEGGTRKASYIVKLKRKRRGDAPSYLDDMTAEKEGRFRTQLLPLLDATLVGAGMPPLRVPRCFLSSWTEGQDCLFLEDLRARGFQRHDRRKALDDAHARLVLQEVGRMHAASLLLSRETEGRMAAKFKFLEWEWHNYSDEARREYRTLLAGALESTSAVAKTLGFDAVAEWFKGMSSRGCEVVEEQLAGGKWDVVGHGDCCVNNVMFRYNAAGQPVEVMLVDLQVCRESSPAIDLNYFILSSLTRSSRDSIESLLSLYHAALSAVLQAAGREPPFTERDLLAEFKQKNTYGFIYSSLLVPGFMAQPGDVINYENNADDFVDELHRNAKRTLAQNPLLKLRLQDLFEDMVQLLEL